MKLYKVTFDDGGWHTNLPSYTIVAESKEDAMKKAREDTHYNQWDCWAYEFKIEGYVIEVYDEKSYNRDKKIKEVL
jgi:hypothetical protein